MTLKRRTVLLGAASLVGTAAWSQSLSGRPIHLIVPYPPGGGTDTLARQIAQGMAERLGVQVIVENRGGGNGQIAGELVARAEPDGTTLLAVENAFVVNPHLFPDYRLDPVKDFSAISLTGTAPLIMVTNPQVPAANVKEFVAYAKSHPTLVSYGSAGTGNPTHIAPEMFKLATGTDILQVPYKGSGPAITDLIGGRVSMMFTGISAVKAFVESGKLRALAVTGTSRSPVMPQVPTLAEAGMPIPDLDQGTWWGIVGPAGLPKPITDRLAEAIRRTTEDPAIKAKLRSLAITPKSCTPEEFSARIQAELVKYGNLIKRAGIKITS